MKKTFSSRGAVGILMGIWTLFAAASLFAQDWQYTTVHSFGDSVGTANLPSSGIILASDGKLYGTALSGGANKTGAVFRCDRNGSGFQIIHDFGPGEDGFGSGGPLAGVLEASDGKLYGATLGGGTNHAGTIYCLNRDGSGFQVIHDFERSTNDYGADIYGELIEGTDGLLYGTTRSGGAFDNGTVFRIAKDGSAFEVLHDFDFSSGAGAFPEVPLLQGSDGALYGATTDNRSDIETPGAGKIFRINPDGSGYAVIHDFDLKADDGIFPGFGLTEGRDGQLYGTTFRGGAVDGGVVFKLRKNGTGYRVLHSFPFRTEPFGPLRKDPSGQLYGITEFGGTENGGTIFSIDENGASLRVIETFGGSVRDAKLPVGAMALDGVGNLYGSSMGGGMGGGGTVFRCPIKGTHQILHSFNATGGDGGNPDSPFSLGTNGILYGTTRAGGSFGQGTIYQVNPDGSGYKVFLNLSETPAGVIADPASSDLYLTTLGSTTHGSGKLYRVTQDGKLKLLHAFRSAKNSFATPSIPLAASDGMLYGLVNGVDKAHNGFVYRIQKNGKGFRVLYAFTNQSGTFPPLIEGSDGMLYGAQPRFSPPTPGTSFKIGKDGTGFTVLRTFDLGSGFGWYTQPTGPLVEGNDGFIYGVGAMGSVPFVYKIDRGGDNFQTGQTFSSEVSGLIKGIDGAVYGVASIGTLFRIDVNFGITSYETPFFDEPVSGLVELPDGEFLGTSETGGDRNTGSIFKLTPPPAN